MWSITDSGTLWGSWWQHLSVHFVAIVVYTAVLLTACQHARALPAIYLCHKLWIYFRGLLFFVCSAVYIYIFVVRFFCAVRISGVHAQIGYCPDYFFCVLYVYSVIYLFICFTHLILYIKKKSLTWFVNAYSAVCIVLKTTRPCVEGMDAWGVLSTVYTAEGCNSSVWQPHSPIKDKKEEEEEWLYNISKINCASFWYASKWIVKHFTSAD